MRRSTYNTRNPYLPMTEEDVLRRLLHQKTKKLMRKRLKSGRLAWMTSLSILVLGVVLTVVFGFVFVKRRVVGSTPQPEEESVPSLIKKSSPTTTNNNNAAVAVASSSRRKTLQKFPSLEFALSHSQLVALYFAASWCPMSTPVSRLLDEHFADLLASDSSTTSKEQQLISNSHRNINNNGDRDRRLLSLVYVSSDQSEEQMLDYLKHRPSWLYVPYDSPDRSLLKKHFKTCAKIEMDELDLQHDRKHEIPTLLVLDSTSQQVLTFTGVKDVEESGAHAFDTWLELARLSNALDAKFQQDDAADDAGDDRVVY